MNFWIQAAAFLVGASAYVIPHTPPSTLARDITTVAGSTGPDYVSISFKTPCTECSPNPNAELDFDLKIDSAANGCDASKITVNGNSLLPLGWDQKFGRLVYRPTSTDNGIEHEVVAEWNLICHENEPSILSLAVVKILESDHIPKSSGFTIVFRQTTPAITKLQDRPFDAASSDNDITSLLTEKHCSDVVVVPSSLEGELQRLEDIKKSIHELVMQHKQQECKIAKMISHEFKQCHGVLPCIFRNLVKQAPDMLALFKAHFRHHPNMRQAKHSDGSFGEEKILNIDSQHGDSNMDEVLQHDELDESDEYRPASLPSDHPPPPPEHVHPHPPPPPHGEPQDGPPPFERPPHHDGGDHHRNGPRPWLLSGDHRPPHFRPHHRHHKPLLISLSAIVLLFVVVTGAFTYVRRHTTLFRDPARRRDRAARCEELSTRAAYHRAACRHRWGQWWSQLRQPESSSDYEEKRSRILEQEGTLEDVMQNEISQLHRAHEIVRDMLRAEEERQRLHHEANFNPGTIIEIGEGSSTRSTRTMATLPPYTRSQLYPQLPDGPPPPSYEEDLEGEMSVVDGFRYTPEGSDGTPDSSVVDCESRLSFDTESTRTRNS